MANLGLNDAKMRYSLSIQADEQAHMDYIAVCDQFEAGHVDHKAIESAWGKVVEAQNARWAAYEYLQRAYGGINV